MLRGYERYLKQTITIYPFSGMSSEGMPTYGTPFTSKCRVEMGSVRKIEEDSESKIGVSKIFLPASISVTLRDKIILSDSTTPTIKEIKNAVGPDGKVWMKVIYLG